MISQNTVVCWFPGAAVTKPPQTEWLYLLPHSSGGWKSKIKVSAEFGSTEASLLDLQRATFSLCLHVVFLLCVSVSSS